MTLKLKIVAGGYGFHPADKGKEVEIVDAVDCSPTGLEDFKILVEATEGEEYFALLLDLPFGVDNWVSPRSFGYTTEQIKEMLEKEQQKEETVEEFYKTIEVGQKVKICGIDRKRTLCEAVVEVTGLYDRSSGDYGFNYSVISGQAPDDIWTVTRSELESREVTVFPYHEECRSSYCECEEGQCSAGKVDMRADEASRIQKNNDVVNSPNHYILFKDIEVKDVVKEVLRRWQDESGVEMSFNQAGMMKEALQYLLRAPKKNKKEDVEKAVYYLNAILEEWNE